MYACSTVKGSMIMPARRNKHVALARGLRPGLALNNYREFQKTSSTDEAALGIVNESYKSIGQVLHE